MKDRLIQTRVPERLENVLKEEAKKRRLTVSHLIRNMLEDTLDLVDTVVQGAGEIAETAGGIAELVARDAGRIAGAAREVVAPRAKDESAGADEEPTSDEYGDGGPAVALDHVLAWNAVVTNRLAACASCHRSLPKGTPAHLGVTQDRLAPPVWLCADCLEDL